MITIGRMAEKYHMLPHEVLSRATSYDLMVQDVLQTYDEHSAAKAGGTLPSAESYNLSDEELFAMMDKARG